ncbi:MAG: hypothetical protein R2827_12410 [Bdellovibrionales bacterium]
MKSLNIIIGLCVFIGLLSTSHAQDSKCDSSSGAKCINVDPVDLCWERMQRDLFLEYENPGSSNSKYVPTKRAALIQTGSGYNLIWNETSGQGANAYRDPGVNVFGMRGKANVRIPNCRSTSNEIDDRLEKNMTRYIADFIARSKLNETNFNENHYEYYRRCAQLDGLHWLQNVEVTNKKGKGYFPFQPRIPVYDNNSNPSGAVR